MTWGEAIRRLAIFLTKTDPEVQTGVLTYYSAKFLAETEEHENEGNWAGSARPLHPSKFTTALFADLWEAGNVLICLVYFEKIAEINLA